MKNLLIMAVIGLLAGCANIQPGPTDYVTKEDVDAAQVMREMNGQHSGRIEY